MNKFYAKFKENCKYIDKYYNNLVLLTKNHTYVGSTNEWIIDNYYLVVENKNSLKKLFKDRKWVKNKVECNYLMYDILLYIFEKHNFNVETSVLMRELNNYQTRHDMFFSYEMIEVIPVFITMLLIEELTTLCARKWDKEDDILKVKKIIDEIDEKRSNGVNVDLEDYIKIDNYLIEHPTYLYHLNANLKEFGSDGDLIFKKLNKFLEENNIILKNVINDEHISSINDNILVSNLFNNLRIIPKLEFPYLCEKISRTEKLLLTDPVYKKMSASTKTMYRGEIVKKTRGKDEYSYVDKIVRKSQQSGKELGEYLFRRKHVNKIFITYISLVLIFTLLISYFVSPYILDNRILSFILLIIPTSEIVIEILNKIFMKFNRPRMIPRMNFSNGIPKEYASIVVIPTIVKDTKKIDKMFENLEKYYLLNKTSNLYFALVGDTCESDTLDCDFDNLVANYGVNKAFELNRKYGKDLFYFMYRKRAYSKGEGKYLGYERKRGALTHFNELLLGKLSKEEIDKYVYIETVSKLRGKIKYVITLDADTELLFNSAIKLVGTMAHPANKPILNRNHTKVISGYGIIEPRVSVDIESTNKSYYSQLMAGIGGFDIYSSIIPNFYQDVFEEGSFVGKGIYDLEVFEQVTRNAFPDNLILSHDLLEGNFLRCGFASDIEVIDDFPPNFLVDMSRIHRWTRGDVQILGFLKRKVKNRELKKVKNPLNALEKFKIFDNLRRILLNPVMLLLLLLSFFKGSPFWTFVFVFLTISLPIFFYLREIFHIQKKNSSFKHYDSLMFGTSALLSRFYINFVTIPYVAIMRLDALFKSLYRMLISHKNLLNWVTAEDAGKKINSKLPTFLCAFKSNYIVSLIIILLAIFNKCNVIITILTVLTFVTAPFILYLVSQDNSTKEDEVLEKNKEDLTKIAYSTWLYFSSFLTESNNYLIPDNYQVNREKKEDYKTSPTDIGMSILSVISAYELSFIKEDEVISYIDSVITSIENLEKWNGLLYNWYNVKKAQKIFPYDISSVDNGNLAACLIVAKSFANKHSYFELERKIENSFSSMDFTKLYTSKDVFSVAYNTSEEKLSIYNYNKFASESRILSFVAIVKGDVPYKHWLCLDKSLTKFRNYKGLTSWSGTSFEYFMPYIFMKSYPNTLLDESYFFSIYCQEEYMKEIDRSMPWGISESAYDELDDGLNYKYKAFSTPYLKVHEDKNQRIVISPYASILAISANPKDVCKNIKKLKKLGLYDKYGFYESYDYDDEKVVAAYFAHHQGMILASLANYLKTDVIRNYFHDDIRVKSGEILLKEKVQLNPVIDLKIYGYKKYSYEKEKVENDIREFDYLSLIPEVSALSNTNYLLLINDRGNGFSRYKKIQLNRYRKITEQDYGMFLYIKDVETGKYWSNTYSPVNVKPDKYNVVFATDRVNFLRQDEGITTKTEIIVTKEHNADIRKITFRNNSKDNKVLELTSYTEPIIIENIEDITHRAFKSLFIESSFNKEYKALVVCRKSNSRASQYVVNRLFSDDDLEISYETERSDFLGRSGTYSKPFAIVSDKNTFSNKTGCSIDPVMSLRTVIEIPKGEERTIYLLNGYGKSVEQINDILSFYSNSSKVSSAFEYATIANNINTKMLGVTGPDMRHYNVMLNYLYQTSKHFISPARKDILAHNSLNQTNLWRFSITGDYPIILVTVHETEALNLVKEIIKAYEFYKSRAIFVDIVVVNMEKNEYKAIIKREVEKEKYRMNTLNDFMLTPGDIFVLDYDNLSQQEYNLLNMVARLRFDTRVCTSLEESIEILQKENKMINYVPLEHDVMVNDDYDNSTLKFYNGYGGFNHDGSEYVITNPNTPLAWCNVLSNDKFGSIVTNNNCGFTYAYNSQMFKITSWTNDVILNDRSEGINVDGKVIDPIRCTHGFGYSSFVYNTNDYKINLNSFVSKDDTVKFYNIKFKNSSHDKTKYKVTFWINPTFGPNEEKSSRYLLSDFYKDFNAVCIRNVYNPTYSNITAFMTSTLPVSTYSVDKILFKSIDVDIEVLPMEEIEFSFMLGCEVGMDNIASLTRKYDSNEKIAVEFEKVKTSWKEKINSIVVKTEDDAFNTIVPWYLYQTISSRLNARAGFYQVGGAFGYRDQLQDSVNICINHENITRNQIINNAKHQFKEGDVLHWWHENIKMGLRSRYKDDFLWLVYAVNQYIKITDDYKILDEKIPFVEGDTLRDNEEERGITYSYSENTSILYEHCMLSLEKSMNEIGANGLPLMGGGDWNDGMNKVGIQGSGTSVWLGFFLYMIMKDFLEITQKYKKVDIEKYNAFLDKLKNALNTVGFDKDYYLRAFFDDGTPIGSRFSFECKIDLISQSFAILSDVILESRIPSVIKSVEDSLVDRKLNIIKLLTPGFNNSISNPGYIMDYPVGIRENGGQYTHAVSWYIMALLKLSQNDKAYDYYQMINPINRTSSKKECNIYKVEPYVIAGDIYSNKDNPARGGWTWYTGSSGWFYNIAITEILGLKRNGNILKIEPRVPSSWKNFEVIFKYIDTLYEIKVKFGEKSDIVIDESRIDENFITLKNDKRLHAVIVNIRR